MEAMDTKKISGWLLTVFGAVVLLCFTALSLIAVVAALIDSSVFAWIFIYGMVAGGGLLLMLYGQRLREGNASREKLLQMVHDLEMKKDLPSTAPKNETQVQ